jgi:hypothetical protein
MKSAAILTSVSVKFPYSLHFFLFFFQLPCIDLQYFHAVKFITLFGMMYLH